ncbi:MAG: ABC transporter permease [bacterium]
MFRNIITIALRNLVRQKSYTLLNIFGLALGIATALLLFAYIRVDLTWDGFHPNADRVVRLVEKQNFGEKELTDVSWIMPPLGPMLVDELPEVEAQCRVMNVWSALISRGENRFYESGISYVDSTFFDIFGFTLEHGNPKTALVRRDGIVLGREMAKRYFGEGEDPMGQTLMLNNEHLVTVTGILADPPTQTHVRIKALIPFPMAAEYSGLNLDSWGNNNHACYLLLSRPDIDLNELGEKITEAFHRHGSWEGLIFWAQPLREMHLYSGKIELDGHNAGVSDISVVLSMAAIASLILIIACVNFINLSTARSVRRSREVGLRKVSGAKRGDLIVQFLGESLLIAFLAMVLAGVIVQLSAPWFSNLVGRETPLNVLDGSFATLSLLGLMFFCGVVAGIYPAFVMSSFSPVKSLRGSGKGSTATGGVLLRRVLVVFQFVVSIGLIISTGVIFRQARYMINRPLGFDKEQVLCLMVHDDEFDSHWETFRDRLLTHADVKAATFSGRLPFIGGGQSGALLEGEEKSRMTNNFNCDASYDDVLGLRVARGRFFSADIATDMAGEEDSTGVIVINEAAVREWGWDQPVGRSLRMWDRRWTVIGVVEDFHYNSLYSEISPIILFNYYNYKSFVGVRFNTDAAQAVLGEVEKVWEEMFPELPFDYIFLNQQYERYYRDVLRITSLLQTFAAIAIGIACLGLLGLAAYAAQRRTHEIAVRKVLGATEGQVLTLISREFLLLVVLANLFAWPVSYYVMNRWLGQFAYHAAMPWWIYPAAGVAALIITVLTISAIALRSARLNPASVLHSE